MKFFILHASFFMAATLLAAANDTLLTFSTPGPDMYRDGTKVLDNECYALVWTQNGSTFGGLAADCQPLLATDRVVAVAPVAKNGRCPTTIFEIDAAYAKTFANGTFALYLLDTRVTKTSLAKLVNGLPVALNSYGVIAGKAEGAGTGTTLSSGIDNSMTAAAAVKLGEVGVYTEVGNPVITAIKVEGAKISLEVSGMSPVADYFVVPGATPTDFKPAVETKNENGTLVIDDAGDNKFFKVIGVRKFE